MKTIKIKFSSNYAEQVGILLFSLELKILMSWTESNLLDEDTIFCVCKLGANNSNIPEQLQIEKIREKSFIKIIKL